MMLMKEYFRARGYPDKPVNNDVRKAQPHAPRFSHQHQQATMKAKVTKSRWF